MPSIVAKILGDATHFDKTVAGVNGKLKGLKKAIGFLGFGLSANAAKNFSLQLIRQGSHLTDVADKLGVTTKYLQEFNYAAQQEGVAATAAEMGLQRFTRRLAEARENTGELLKVIKKYNIELFNADGTARAAGGVMEDLSRIIQNTEDPAERLRIAFKAFDSEGAALVNVLRKGPEAMRAWIKEANNIGAVISDERLRQMDEYSDRIDKVTASLKGLATEFLGIALDGHGDVFDEAEAIFQRKLAAKELNERVNKQAEAEIRDNEKLKGWGIFEKVQLSDGSWIKMSERIKQVSADIRREIETTEKKAAAAAVAAKKLSEEIAATKAEEEKLARANMAGLVAGWFKTGNQVLANMNEQMLRGQLLMKLDEKRRDLMEKQADALSEQKRIQGELADYRNRHLNPTFDDYVNGVGGAESQRLANRVLEQRMRVKELIARQYTNARGEAQGPSDALVDRERKRLADIENKFESRTGQDLHPEEAAFKTALATTEKELQNITTEIKKL